MTDPLPNSAKKSPSRPRAFRRRIFILLGVLVVLIIIALVGAQTIGDECRLYQKISNPKETAPGNEFTGGVPSGWRFMRTICQKSRAGKEAKIEPTFEGDVENLEIIVTNKTDQHYFVPYKTKKELASFAQWANTVKRVKDPSGRPKYVSSGVELCVKDKAKGTTTRIADGGYSADVVGCGLACTVTEIKGQQCVAKAGVTDWEVITQKHLAGASL